jgi:prevent-host-death family protein
MIIVSSKTGPIVDRGEMKTVGAYEAKTHLAQLLDAVENGETITITRHGVPVAMLVPPPAKQRPNIDDVIAELEALQGEVSLDGLSIREMIEKGRA